ncbi:MAG: MraY family glycosyltransferase [Saprospiraceae bacterium]|nr:undecaprenyl/decaprenyl-phosphate alpha-N-acetylglucosaminyl 1-phosphate transferase [Saprospiraceae bacterium]MDW8230504.1 MraY family glycosyltransferase [Saprospiraceae bacterium]
MQPFGWVFFTALGITGVVTLALLPLARRMGFYDVPNERSAHREPAPLVGGLAFAVGTLASVLLWSTASARSLAPALASLALIAVVGWLDDRLRLSPGRKLLGQLAVAALLVGWAGMRVEHLEGLAGIGALPEPVVLIVSVVGVVGIINAFNLVDGINGLAGGLGLWTCAAFGGWMYGVGQVHYALLAAALGGALCAFLYFNIASPVRVFMGDAGSMFIGAAAALLALQFLSFNRALPDGHAWRLAAGPAFVAAVLFVPLFDEVRVFALRLLRGRSPLRADREHAHHRLLEKGFSHSQASALLVGCCVAVTLVVWRLQHLDIHLLVLLEGALALAASAWLARRRDAGI